MERINFVYGASVNALVFHPDRFSRAEHSPRAEASSQWCVATIGRALPSESVQRSRHWHPLTDGSEGMI